MVETNQMNNAKIFALISIPLGLVFLFWLFSWAFDMISAPNDGCVVMGVVLALIGLFILFKLLQYILKNILP